MIRLTKLTDYGVVLMTHLASILENWPTASALSQKTQIATPTVAKILKVLSREGLLRSHRGANGGYTLARDPREVSVAEIISAMEGPIAVTECAEVGASECVQEDVCAVRGNWQRINDAVRGALENISLEEMAQPLRLPDGAFDSPLVNLGGADPS